MFRVYLICEYIVNRERFSKCFGFAFADRVGTSVDMMFASNSKSNCQNFPLFATALYVICFGCLCTQTSDVGPSKFNQTKVNFLNCMLFAILPKRLNQQAPIRRLFCLCANWGCYVVENCIHSEGQTFGSSLALL